MIIHGVEDDPILQVPGQTPSMSSKYALRGDNLANFANLASLANYAN